MWRRFSEEERETIWDMREAGVPVKRIAKHLGRQNVSLRKFLADAGGKRPTARQRSELRLSLEEREEISRVCVPKTSSGLLSWDDAPRAVSESHHGVTATAPVLPVVGSCESDSQIIDGTFPSLNTFVQVTRSDDLLGTHTLQSTSGTTTEDDRIAALTSRRPN